MKLTGAKHSAVVLGVHALSVKDVALHAHVMHAGDLWHVGYTALKCNIWFFLISIAQRYGITDCLRILSNAAVTLATE